LCILLVVGKILIPWVSAHVVVSVLWFWVSSPFPLSCSFRFQFVGFGGMLLGFKGMTERWVIWVAADCRNERTCPTLFNKFWDLRTGAELEQKVTSTPPKLTGMD
jgi:hypothetical protein